MCTSPPQQEQSVESVDGEVVTSQQPRSPSPHLGHSRGKKRREEEEGGGERGERESLAALEAAEQQVILIHDEYKKLLREKEVKRFITSMLHVYSHKWNVHLASINADDIRYIHSVWACLEYLIVSVTRF